MNPGQLRRATSLVHAGDLQVEETDEIIRILDGKVAALTYHKADLEIPAYEVIDLSYRLVVSDGGTNGGADQGVRESLSGYGQPVTPRAMAVFAKISAKSKEKRT